MLKAGQNMMKYGEKDTKTTQNVFVMVQRLMNLITIFFYKVWSVLDLLKIVNVYWYSFAILHKRVNDP